MLKYIGELKWDSKSEEHIRKHNVTITEVWESCGCARPLFYRVGSKRYAVLGQTEGGRYLLTILKRVRRETYSLITARDMKDGERKRYRKWLGR